MKGPMPNNFAKNKKKKSHQNHESVQQDQQNDRNKREVRNIIKIKRQRSPQMQNRRRKEDTIQKMASSGEA